MVSTEDFEQWRDNPVTRWVMQAHANAADDLRNDWITASWGNDIADPALLANLKTRADAYRAICDATHADIAQFFNDGDPE